MAHLFLDPGSSGTKILVVDQFCESHFVESGVEKIPALTKEQRQDESSIAYDYGTGIVELNGDTYRVGDRPVTCLSQGLKYTGAIIKAIAAIASQDCDRGLTYELGFVLPLDEYASAKDFADGLRQSISKAKVNGKTVTAKIGSIRINPEGGGLIPLKSGVHVAVMVGHTDVSLIRFQNGRVDQSLSQTIGRRGIGAIATSLGIPGDDMSIALAMTKGKMASLARNGLTVGAIEAAEKAQVQEFVLKQIGPMLCAYQWNRVESVVLGGGGAKYLLPWIDGYFPVAPKLTRSPKGLKLFGGADAARFTDLYGLVYQQLKDVIDAKLSGDEVKAVPVEVVA